MLGKFLSGVIETICLFKCIVLFPFPTEEVPHPTYHHEAKPVLLIHGYLHNNSAWGHYCRELVEAGYGPIYAVNLGNPLKSIDEHAELVAEQIQQLEGWSIIGHSLGGVVACEVAMRFPERVDKVITLGSPLEGSYVAAIGFGGAAQDIYPGSPFLARFREKMANNQQVRCYHLGSCDDWLIVPTTSAVPAFSGYSKTYLLEEVGHLTFFFSDEVLSHVLHFLWDEQDQ